MQRGTRGRAALLLAASAVAVWSDKTIAGDLPPANSGAIAGSVHSSSQLRPQWSAVATVNGLPVVSDSRVADVGLVRTAFGTPELGCRLLKGDSAYNHEEVHQTDLQSTVDESLAGLSAERTTLPLEVTSASDSSHHTPDRYVDGVVPRSNRSTGVLMSASGTLLSGCLPPGPVRGLAQMAFMSGSIVTPALLGAGPVLTGAIDSRTGSLDGLQLSAVVGSTPVWPKTGDITQPQAPTENDQSTLPPRYVPQFTTFQLSTFELNAPAQFVAVPQMGTSVVIDDGQQAPTTSTARTTTATLAGTSVYFDRNDKPMSLTGPEADSAQPGKRSSGLDLTPWFEQAQSLDPVEVGAQIEAAQKFQTLAVMPSVARKDRAVNDTGVALGVSDLVVSEGYVGDADVEGMVDGVEFGVLIQNASIADEPSVADIAYDFVMAPEEFRELFSSLVARVPGFDLVGLRLGQGLGGSGPGYRSGGPSSLIVPARTSSRYFPPTSTLLGSDPLGNTNDFNGDNGTSGGQAGDRATIAAGETFQGTGLFTGLFRNRGTVLANLAGQSIEFRSPAPPFEHLNEGSMQAVSGGTLFFNGGRFQNVSTITASSGGIIDILGGQIDQTRIDVADQPGVTVIGSGGTINIEDASLASGSLILNPSSTTILRNGTLAGVTVVANGPISIPGGSSATIANVGGGSFDLNSTLTVNSDKLPTTSSLILDGSVIINSSLGRGTVRLEEGSRVTTNTGSSLQLSSGVTVTGTGTLAAVTTFGTGSVATAGAGETLTLSDGTKTNNGGLLSATSGGKLSLSDVINQNASGRIQALSGGTILLSDATVTGGNLSVAAGANLLGQGTLALTFSNSGTLSADTLGGTLNINKNGSNSGLITAINGGILSFNAVTITQTTDGMILADTGDIELNDSTIRGGTLTTGSTGTIFSSNSILDGVNVPTGTNIRIVGGSSAALTSSLSNAGNITVGGEGSDATSLTVTHALVLRGQGKILLDASNATLAGAPLTNSPGHTIAGIGNITVSLNNHGALIASPTKAHSSISPQASQPNTLNVHTPLESDGLVAANSGATLELLKSASLSSGAVLAVDQGGKVIVTEGLHITSGTVRKTGTGPLVLRASATLDLAAGSTLSLVEGSIIRQSDSSSSSLLADTRALISRAFDGGTWTGTGLAKADNAAEPANPLMGLGYADAAHVLGLTGSETGDWDGVPVTAHSVLVVQTYVGDTNLDGVVDSTDVANVMAGFASGASGWANGDFNYDGLVTSADMQRLADALAKAPAPLANLAKIGQRVVGAAIPEPSALGIVIPALALLTRRRR